MNNGDTTGRVIEIASRLYGKTIDEVYKAIDENRKPPVFNSIGVIARIRFCRIMGDSVESIAFHYNLSRSAVWRLTGDLGIKDKTGRKDYTPIDEDYVRFLHDECGYSNKMILQIIGITSNRRLVAILDPEKYAKRVRFPLDSKRGTGYNSYIGRRKRTDDHH